MADRINFLRNRTEVYQAHDEHRSDKTRFPQGCAFNCGETFYLAYTEALRQECSAKECLDTAIREHNRKVEWSTQNVGLD